MGRHSGPAQAELTFANIAAEPAPGSRRARMRAEREAAEQHSSKVMDEVSGAIEKATSEATESHAQAAPQWPSRDEFAASLTTETPISIHKPSKFSLFSRSRAVTAAVAVMASGLGAVGVASSSSVAEAAEDQASTAVPVSARETLADELSTTFTVTVDGEARTITTQAQNLGDALAEAGIIVNASDRVSSAMAAPVINGASITVTRITVATETETVTDPFTSQEVSDDTLAKGTTQVETAGQDGVTTNTYEVTYQDGTEVSRVLTIAATTQQRVDEVVKVGTKEETVAATATASASSSSSSSSSSSAAVSTASVVPAGEAQQIAYSMLAGYGWGDDQFSCLVNLWNRESGWSVTAANPSGAYGIPQALPGSKMGAGWESDATVQITWGLGYISGRYGTPCGAWSAFLSKGWY